MIVVKSRLQVRAGGAAAGGGAVLLAGAAVWCCWPVLLAGAAGSIKPKGFVCGLNRSARQRGVFLFNFLGL